MYCFLSGGYGHGGGAQTIQLLLFKNLTKRGEKCKLFDVKGGSAHIAFMETNLPFEFIEIDKPKSKKKYDKFLQEDDLLIVFDTNFFGSLLYFSQSKCKILVWEIFYPWVERFVYTRYFPIKWLAQQQEKKILSEIVRKNAFFFIDYLGKEAVEKRLDTSIPDSFYLPIPIELTINMALRKKKNSTKLIISYVGRSVNWKINPIIKVIKDYQNCNDHFQVDFRIICDDMVKFKKELEKKIDAFNKISIQFFERLSLNQLHDILTESDLHFAMGTAALDGAKLGVPTIVVDASYIDFPDNYKYRWIFETEKLHLGRVINAKMKELDGNHSFSEIINDLIQNRNQISAKCYEYVKENYGIEKIADKIVNYGKTANLSFKPFQSMFTIRYFRMLRRLSIR